MTYSAGWFCRILCLGSLAGVAIVGVPAKAVAEPIIYTPYQPPDAVPAAAPAEPLVVATVPAPPPIRRWYGYQLMLADAATLGLAYQLNQPAIGLALWAAPPTIHGLHHNKRMAITSPVMRTLLPVLGGALGVSMAECHHEENSFDFCPLGQMGAGMVVGMVVAALVDYTLAWEEVVPAAPALPARPGVTLSVPAVAPIANGAALVMGGAF